MKDINDDTNHMDICQGKAFHDVISNYNIQSAKGRNKIFKLIFDKKAYMMISRNSICFIQMKPKSLNVV